MSRTAHTLTRKPNDTFHDDPGYFSAAETLDIGGRHYGVGGWDETTTGRPAFGEDPVPGPQVYTYQHATVIALHPLPDTNTYVRALIGDIVYLAGHAYEIKRAPNDNIALVPVDDIEQRAFAAVVDLDAQAPIRLIGWMVGRNPQAVLDAVQAMHDFDEVTRLMTSAQPD